MILRIVDGQKNIRGDWVVKIVALDDEGDELGSDGWVNLSNMAQRKAFIKQCAEETGQPTEQVQARLTQLVKRVQQGALDEDEVLGDGLDGPPSDVEQEPREMIRVANRYLRDISTDATKALHEANGKDTRIFLRGGLLARIHEQDREIIVQALSHAALKGRLDRVANFITLSPEGADKPARPPNDVIQDILTRQDLPFPRLRALAGIPVAIPGGKMLDDVGYDAATGVYRYHNNLGPIPRMAPGRAKDLLLNELLGDFPFSDDGSRAHTVALLLQPFVLPIISGATPLYSVDSPTPGTGKGLIAEVLSEIVTGQPVGVMILTRDEAEIEKRITALLIRGQEIILLDNVSSLHSHALAGALTSRSWEGRMLGRLDMVRVENNSTWIATGNNVKLSTEMARRCIPIRLDPRMEHPEDRTGFRHPSLFEWVGENRAQLVGAIVCLIRAWQAEGMPDGSQTIGSYEAWARTMGGLLDVIGVRGFLSNRRSLYEEADRDTDEWRAFCEVWAKEFGSRGVTAKDLVDLATEEELLLGVRAGKSALAAQQRMGHALSDRRDRVFGQWAIRSAGRDGVTRNRAYALDDVADGLCVCPPEQQAEGIDGRCPDCGGMRGESG